MPALLAHTVTNSVDIVLVRAKGHDRKLGVTNDVKFTSEASPQLFGKVASRTNDLLGRLGVTAERQI